METSKKLLYLSYLIAIILIIIVVITTVIQLDNTNLVILAGAWITECATYSGFYLWKAKNENRSKYAQRFIQKDYIKSLIKEYGLDSTIRILEIVLRD